MLANTVMKASDGRLSPFQPLADDDGLDMLFFDKKTGKSVAIQLKCRTVTLHKRNSEERGNTVHFQVRQATFNETRCAHLVAALLNEELTDFVAIWFIPMALLPEVGNHRPDKIVIRPSKAEDSADRYRQYRCQTPKELVQKILEITDSENPLY